MPRSGQIEDDSSESCTETMKQAEQLRALRRLFHLADFVLVSS